MTLHGTILKGPDPEQSSLGQLTEANANIFSIHQLLPKLSIESESATMDREDTLRQK